MKNKGDIKLLIEFLETDLKDLWEWDAYNKDFLNNELDELKTIIEKMKERVKKL